MSRFVLADPLIKYLVSPDSAPDSSSRKPFYGENEISIGTPRMQADAVTGDSREVEYQYSFHQSGRRLTGLGIGGVEYFIKRPGYRERLFTIDISTHPALTAALRIKPVLGGPEDDFTYLHELAQGLLEGFRRETGSLVNQRYVVFSNVEALAQLSIRVPTGFVPNLNGMLVLAQTFTPADAC